MSAMLSPYSTVGFCNTPVTKGLLGATLVTSCALNIPQLAPWRRYFIFSFTDIFDKKEVWRLFTSHVAFLDIQGLVCGALLMYYFRVFERRYGSRKFSSYLLSTSTITILLQVLVLYCLRLWNQEFFSFTTGYFFPGPIGFIFPLFVSYFFDIPRVAHTHILGVPITGKTLTYLAGVQMVISSTSTAVTGSCAIVAGLMYRYNFLMIQKWFVVPKSIAKLVDATIGRLISTPPQNSTAPMGATLDIQRVQQMELLEQQMLQSRMREARRGEQLFQHLFNPGAGGGNAGIQRRIPRNDDNDESDDSAASDVNNGNAGEDENVYIESQVQALVAMGFDRQEVLNALRLSGNDLNTATTILLQER